MNNSIPDDMLMDHAILCLQEFVSKHNDSYDPWLVSRAKLVIDMLRRRGIYGLSSIVYPKSSGSLLSVDEE